MFRPPTSREGPAAWPARRRLPFALAAAYLAGFLVELATGGSRLDAVGWRDPWFPLATEGLAVGLLARGWLGFAVAPLPFLLTPETVRWTWEAVRAVQRGDTLLGYLALFYLLPLFLVPYAGGVVGALVGWVVWGRRPRR